LTRIFHLTLSLLLATALFAETTPHVDNITPRSGPTSGGIDVTLTGTNLKSQIVCILPCPTLVAFGDAKVEPYRITDTEITVKAPAHAAGTVDVTLMMPGGTSTTVPQGFTFGDTLATTWEPLLIPVYIDGFQSGAAGSQWRTNLWIQNGGKESLLLAPWPCLFDICPAIFPLTKALLPGESQHNLPTAFAKLPTPGRIIYLNRTAADSALMNLRVVDDSGIAVDSGTEIPLVRERNLLTSATTLINVPLLNNRLLLRVYDVALFSAQFRVRVFVQGEVLPDTPLAEKTLNAVTTDQGELHVTPAYAEYPIEISFGPVLLAKDAAVRVEITPLTDRSRYWAFVSATNNSTNHVTLTTPQ
jgi:hypothetical protein